MSLGEGFEVWFRGVVGGGFPVANEGKREGEWGGREGGGWGGDRQRKRQVNAQALSKRPFTKLIDLLMGLFRGAVFRHGGGALKQPIKDPTETPTSTLALMGRFPSLIGRFPTLVGRFTDFVLRGRFYVLKIHWKTAH